MTFGNLTADEKKYKAGRGNVETDDGMQVRMDGNYVIEYADKIESGEIVTSKRVKKVYSRLANDIRQPKAESRWRFDIEKGNRPIEFIERFCRQSEGNFGAQIKLDLWQKAFIMAVFGFVSKETGYRRFTECMLLCGRKNGKTTLLSGIALYLMIADGEGAAEIYCVATKLEQAKKCLSSAINMRRHSAEISACTRKRKSDIYFPMTASFFMALATETKTMDGLNAHGVIIDELHAIKGRDLYDVMRQSVTARRQPLIIMITTAGEERESIYDDRYEYYRDLADGIRDTETDERFLGILYELDERAEWTEPSCWVKANPGLGTIKSMQKLAEEVDSAKRNPAEVRTVLCKDFNVRESGSAAWLSFDTVNNPEKFDMSELYDTYGIGGCDLSATTDLTCATVLVRKRKSEKIYVLQMYFLPSAKIEMLEEKGTNEAPYAAWEKRGLLRVCPGNRVDYSMVTAWFDELADKYKIDLYKCGYDRALAGYWLEEMKDHGYVMEQVAQGPFTMSQPMKEMEAAFADRRVIYNDNPILKWCLTNTAIKKSGINNIQPVKITEKRRIDGTVSLIDAWVVYVKFYDDYMYAVG